MDYKNPQNRPESPHLTVLNQDKSKLTKTNKKPTQVHPLASLQDGTNKWYGTPGHVDIVWDSDWTMGQS